MKFTPREMIKHSGMVFEAGNTYTSSLYGLSDAEVMAFHAAGWSDVEGADEPGERIVKGSVVRPDSASLTTNSPEV